LLSRDIATGGLGCSMAARGKNMKNHAVVKLFSIAIFIGKFDFHELELGENL
jgi:hypothetical protein